MIRDIAAADNRILIVTLSHYSLTANSIHRHHHAQALVEPHDRAFAGARANAGHDLARLLAIAISGIRKQLPSHIYERVVAKGLLLSNLTELLATSPRGGPLTTSSYPDDFAQRERAIRVGHELAAGGATSTNS